jgi:hypothetical protein
MNSKKIASPIVCPNISSLLIEAERGCSKSQQLLGRYLIDFAGDAASKLQAYKWLFISSALGNKAAEPDFQGIHGTLKDEDADDAYQLAESWFDEKFDLVEEMPDAAWSLELLKWRFSSSNVH